MKKLIASLLAMFMVIMLIPQTVSAEEAQIGYERTVTINGITSGYWSEELLLKKGDEVTFSVSNVTLNGNSVENVQYQWQEARPGDELFKEIEGATSPECSIVYDGTCKYACFITIGEESVSTEFYTREDTLELGGSSDGEIELEDENAIKIYQLYDIPLNAERQLIVNAKSSHPDAALTYKWTREVLGMSWGSEVQEEELPTTGNIHTFKKTVGTELFRCSVSDGNVTKEIWFKVNPTETLTNTPVINGVSPNPFERGYMYVAKPGEQVEMQINATSENPITYQWQKFQQSGEEWKWVTVGTEASLTVTKQDIAENNGFEQFECFIQDGNEIKNVSFVLFCLKPDQVVTEVEKNEAVPEIVINNDLESLSNDLLADSLEELSYGMTAEITLTAENQQNVSEEEKAAISEVFPADGVTYLNMNLYSEVQGREREQISETATKINLSVDIPKDMINADDSTTREYGVVRMHGGKAEVLECAYDAETESITFDTDKFSTYALTYKDKKAPTVPDEEDNTTDDTDEGDAEDNTTGDISEDNKENNKVDNNVDESGKDNVDETDSSKAVKTGDETNVMLWFGMMSIAFVSAVIISKKKKFNN